jgi:hypothetical protein
MKVHKDADSFLSHCIYPPAHLLLPPVPIPTPIREFIIDATDPLSPAELRHLRDGNYTLPAAKFINRILTREQADERERAVRSEDDKRITHSLQDPSI